MRAFTSDAPARSHDGRPRVAVIGAGISGICLGVQLRRAGYSNFVIFEKSQRAGGTWYENTYPGCGCDVPSFLYSFSFAPKHDWSRRYAPQSEIFDYLQQVVEQFELESHIRYGCSVESAQWDEANSVWRIRLGDGRTETADVLVSAVGQLNIPHTPQIPGQDQFPGPQFHSARWNPQIDLRDRRVAIIGNAASTIQLLKPVADQARQTYVFQRTPNYVMLKRDFAFDPKTQARFAKHPWLLRAYRSLIFLRNESRFLIFRRRGIASLYYTWRLRLAMKSRIRPELHPQVIPTYPVGCKRILLSDDYHETIQRPDVQLVTAPIEGLNHSGVQAGAQNYPADVVIYATGFVSNPLLSRLKILGRDNRTLAAEWEERPHAYLGLLTPGFPNFFTLYGPNTNLGHNSIIFMVECQVRYLIQCLDLLRSRRCRTVEVRPQAASRFSDRLERNLRKRIWNNGCSNWYRNTAGVIVNNWSGPSLTYWWQTRQVRMGDLEFASGEDAEEQRSRQRTTEQPQRR